MWRCIHVIAHHHFHGLCCLALQETIFSPLCFHWLPSFYEFYLNNFADLQGICNACRPVSHFSSYYLHLLVFEMCTFRILHFLQRCVSDFMEPVIPPAWFNWGHVGREPWNYYKTRLIISEHVVFTQNPSRVDAKDTIAGHVSAGFINVYL